MSRTINHPQIWEAWESLIGQDAPPLSMGPAYPLPIVDLTPRLEKGTIVKRFRVDAFNRIVNQEFDIGEVTSIDIDLSISTTAQDQSFDFYIDAYAEFSPTWQRIARLIRYSWTNMGDKPGWPNRQVVASIDVSTLAQDDYSFGRPEAMLTRGTLPKLFQILITASNQLEVMGTITFWNRMS